MKKLHWGFWLAVISFVLLVTIFTFYDLPLSLAAVDAESTFARAADSFGPWPAPIAGLLSCLAIFYALPKRTSPLTLILHILFFGGATLSGAFVFFVPLHYSHHAPFRVEFLLLGLSAVALGSMFFSRIDRRWAPFLLRAGLCVLAVLAVQLAGIHLLLKPLWGRVRFRDMTDPLNQFTPWYLPQPGPGTSFPSGHTGNAAMTVSILVIAEADKYSHLRRFFWILSLAVTALVAAGRVVAGAHFATDVLFGGGITFAAFLLFRRLFFRRSPV